LPAFACFAVLRLQRGAVRNLVALTLATVVVVNQDFTGACDDNQLALGIGDVAHGRRETDGARRFALELRRRRGSRCGATDVERPHRELCTRFANRLRGDDAHRFADIHEMPAAEIAAVTRRAQSVSRIAGERRAHLDFIDAEHLDLLDFILAEQRARLE
jgi:hypothetical protein